MVLTALLALAVGNGIDTDVTVTRFSRAEAFLQAVRDNLVEGNSSQVGPLGTARVESWPGGTQFLIDHPKSRSFGVIVKTHPSGKAWVARAFFDGHRGVGSTTRDPMLEFNPNRLPAVMSNLARAAGFEGDVQINAVRPTGTQITRVEASLYWKGLLVLPPRRFLADFHYATGALVDAYFFYLLDLPPEEPQLLVNQELITDRFVQDALNRAGVSQIAKVHVALVVGRPEVFDPENSNVAWLQQSMRLAALQERGVYSLIATSGWDSNVYTATYDPKSGELLRWHDSRGAYGGPSSSRVARPTAAGRGALRLLSGKRVEKVDGSLEPAEKPVEFVGKPLVLRRETAAWRIEYDRKSGLVKLGDEFFKPSKAVKVALDKITR